MDKDLIILKNEQLKSDDLKSDIEALEKNNDDQDDALANMQRRLDALYKANNKPKLLEVPKLFKDKQKDKADIKPDISYDELYEESCGELRVRGLDVDSIGFDSFLSDSEIADVLAELDSPLPREDRWKKSDFIVVFIAALVGGVTDYILGNRKNKVTGKNSKFSDWLNEFHEKKWKHAGGAPIDFQGKIDGISFGGGNHRDLSRGHDLLRFVDGIKSFKNGIFEAVGYRDGVKIHVLSAVNQNGTEYETMTLVAAIIEYFHHMIADFLSNNSLPFPGYSFFREADNRKTRKLAADMYAAGFNLKNVIIQAASTIAIEIIIRIYFSIQSVKHYSESVEIAEDYSNWEAIKQFVRPANKDKLHEMLLVAHAIVTAVNIGKIVITKDVSSINITEISSVVNYGIKVLKAVAKRNGEYAKLIYHSSEVQDRWSKIEEEVLIPDEALIVEMQEELIIA